MGLPVAARRVIVEARAARTAAIAAEQIRRHAAFIQKHVVTHVAQRLRVLPLASRSGDVSATLFVRVYGFLTAGPNRSMARHSVLSAAVVGSCSRNSAKVVSRRPSPAITPRLRDDASNFALRNYPMQLRNYAITQLRDFATTQCNDPIAQSPNAITQLPNHPMQLPNYAITQLPNLPAPPGSPSPGRTWRPPGRRRHWPGAPPRSPWRRRRSRARASPRRCRRRR